jgi:hypothetical protein
MTEAAERLCATARTYDAWAYRALREGCPTWADRCHWIAERLRRNAAQLTLFCLPDAQPEAHNAGA